MKLWVVGKVNKKNHRQWEFQGVFDDMGVAEDTCKDESWFVGPVTLNQVIPDETIVWPGACYYPFSKSMLLPILEDQPPTIKRA